MRKLVISSIFSFLLLISSYSIVAQTPEMPNAVGVKVLFLDYFTPNPGESATLDDITNGFEISYNRSLSKNLDLGIPLRFGVINLANDIDNKSIAGLDALLRLKLYNPDNVITPYLFAGGGYVLEDGDQGHLQVPVGLGFNFQAWKRAAINLQGAYRYSPDDFKKNLELGLGFYVNLGKISEDEIDSDGDGIPDKMDKCPKEKGSKMAQGCPDRDGDGAPDKDDECPDDPGPVNGCPDKDKDGIADKDDDCPDEPGLAELKGCPKPDSDGDGVPDEMDKCPNEAGIASLQGCPNKDSDGDGVADGIDDCPTQAGTLATKGCPDSDGDGVIDKDDLCPNEAGIAALYGCPDSDGDGIANRNDNCPNTPGLAQFNGCPDSDNDGVADPNDKCPNTAGPSSNFGCPELLPEEKDALSLAMRAIQFETGKATLKVSSYTVLDQIVEILNKYPNYKVIIAGHTDSVGSDQSNLKLSEDRAKSCYDYLLSKNFSSSRMSYVGYGESRPIASNATREGRSLNRRVEFNLYLN